MTAHGIRDGLGWLEALSLARPNDPAGIWLTRHPETDGYACPSIVLAGGGWLEALSASRPFHCREDLNLTFIQTGARWVCVSKCGVDNTRVISARNRLKQDSGVTVLHTH